MLDLNLQRFAEGGNGAAGAASAGEGAEKGQGAPEAAQEATIPHLGRRGRENPLANVRYGVQKGQETKAQQPEEGQPEKAAFDDLIKGDYKADFDAKVQAILKDRFKGREAQEKKMAAMEPILQTLAQKYNVAADDVEGLARKLQDEGIEEEANQRGVDVETLRTMRQLEADSKRLHALEAQSAEEQMLRQHWEKLSTQAQEMKAIFPNFDLAHELQTDERFARLTSPQNGVSVKDAYFAIHHDEIQQASMQYAGQRAAEKIAASVQANAARPREGGMQGQNPVIVKTDPTKFTKADRAEIRRRVQNGEEITL